MNIQVTNISSKEAKKKLSQGAFLVDVREFYEIDENPYQVKNQYQIPLSQFEHEFIQLPKDKELILACKAGVRSFQASAYLIYMGYDTDKIFNLEAGMMMWL